MTSPPRHAFVRTRWWWVRHAPVRGDGGRIYGGSDIACDCGDAHVFSGLSPVLPRGAVWVSSHLGRTRQTAEALWQAGDFTVEGAHPPLTALPALAEQNLGEWQGQDRARFFAERQPLAASYWFAPADERPPGGESFVEMCERVHAAIAEVTAAHRGRDIVAVAHGGTIRAALALALALPPQGGLAFAIENCSLTRLDHYDGPDGTGWRVGMVNGQPWLGTSPVGTSPDGGPAA
ncbi:histidine phosphatase family protein [Methylobacterium oryzisoli]|uniref:histidine phosphatase family protein n=1 Tax=Methylobacterium oryzisoli TaxID=3385502 RepID=UPI003892A88A